MNGIENYFDIDGLLTEEHKMIRQSTRDWCDQKLRPYIKDYYEEKRFPLELIPEMGEMGFFGPSLPAEYGGGGLDDITYGLIMQELERIDSGVRSMASVQGSLAMYAIYRWGTEEQKQRFLPKMGTGEYIGCFGLTEPNHGSDPGSMMTRIKKVDGGYILNGSKMWITNGSIAALAVVWAKDEEGIVRGVIVEKDMEGFETEIIKDKLSLRASITSTLYFHDVFIPEENYMTEARGLKGPLSCLSKARYGISWGVLGAAMDCLNAALKYSQERVQFGKPIAGFQLTQKKLAEMLTELVKAQHMTLRLGQLMNEGRATPAQISMAKRNNVHTALEIARTSRQIAGGMGITGDYPFMRHMMNLETVLTYEGTHDIHLLITGMDMTGLNAFK